MTTDALTAFRALSIGMDNLFSNIASTQNTTGFPPYNLYKIGENKFLIELALAGYQKEAIKITLKNGLLLIANTKEPSNLYKINYSLLADRNENEEIVTVLHNGISSRWFKRSFQLAEGIIVKNAEFNEGILTIELEQPVPEEKKIKTISIK